MLPHLVIAASPFCVAPPVSWCLTRFVVVDGQLHLRGVLVGYAAVLALLGVKVLVTKEVVVPLLLEASDVPQSCGPRLPVPSRLHQIWLQGEASAPSVHLESWRSRHPSWDHRVWNQTSLRLFIVQTQPDALRYFDAYDNPGIKSDIGRVLLLKHLGGVYVDTDVACMRPVDDLVRSVPDSGIAGDRVVSPLLVAKSIEPTRFARRPPNSSHISNYFIAAPAHHAFLDLMVRSWNLSHPQLQGLGVVQQELELAGPRKWHKLAGLWNTHQQAANCPVRSLSEKTFVRYVGDVVAGTYGRHEYANLWLPRSCWLLDDVYMALAQWGYDVVFAYTFTVSVLILAIWPSVRMLLRHRLEARRASPPSALARDGRRKVR